MDPVKFVQKEAAAAAANKTEQQHLRHQLPLLIQQQQEKLQQIYQATAAPASPDSTESGHQIAVMEELLVLQRQIAAMINRCLELMEQIMLKKKLPVFPYFSANMHDEVDNWIAQAKYTGNAQNEADEDLLQSAVLAMKGRAKRWVRDFFSGGGVFTSWEDFQNKLRGKFGSGPTVWEKLSRLKAIKQQGHLKDIHDYILDFKLAAYALPQLDEFSKIVYFATGCHYLIRVAIIRADPQSLLETFDVARLEHSVLLYSNDPNYFQQDHNSQKSHSGKGSGRGDALAGSQYCTPRKAKKNFWCYKCNEAGHFARNCLSGDQDSPASSNASPQSRQKGRGCQSK